MITTLTHLTIENAVSVLGSGERIVNSGFINFRPPVSIFGYGLLVFPLNMSVEEAAGQFPISASKKDIDDAGFLLRVGGTALVTGSLREDFDSHFGRSLTVARLVAILSNKTGHRITQLIQKDAGDNFRTRTIFNGVNY